MVLLGTTILWAVLGARVQVHNADQLSDPYMFASSATFHAASFPGAHTFLLKWPIFWLLGIVGISSTSLLVATVGVVLVTVATLVAILYKIDKRPLVFGTVCLGLALALLLVPAQPYVGGILPVNMAMLTTRNLEYAVYLAALVLFAYAHRLRSLSFVLGVLLLTILVASDKLFLSLSLGGALLMLLAYALRSNWNMATFAVRWVVGSILAAIGSAVVLMAISALHVTHLANSAAATPYGVVHTPQGLVLGFVYVTMGLLTNAGANPAYDNTTLRNLPGMLVTHLWSYRGLAYLVAAAVLAYGVFCVWRVVRQTVKVNPRGTKPPAAELLSLALVASTLAACAVFVVTDHYYAVDARYLAISLFALVITVGVWLRRLKWQWPEDLLLIACGLVVAIAVAVAATLHITTQQQAAFNTIGKRNSLIADALKRHKVDELVGDYWRVLPIKLASHGHLNVMPLAGCTQPNSVLTSAAWQLDLTKHSFAYLITLDGSLTGFPPCSLDQITAVYGRSNATQIISGTLAKPTEALIFYDAGSHPVTKSSPVHPAPPSLLPIGIDQLTKTNCMQPTIMNVVAHQDDDLLFLSPDLLHQLHDHKCIRTVYLTAGDAGHGKFYWLSRQLGAEAAYSTMLGTTDLWDQQTVLLQNGGYITIATLRTSHQVSLVFVNLPDGNLHGQGFATSGYESLAKLWRDEIPTLHAVDGESSYTKSQLVDALFTLMNIYQPAEVHTQADVVSAQYPDHSDHIATSNFAQAAVAQYDQLHFGGSVNIPVRHYIGYPIHSEPTNIADDDLAQKVAAFLSYGQYDTGVCRTLAQCDLQTTTYGFYLRRQYQQ